MEDNKDIKNQEDKAEKKVDNPTPQEQQAPVEEENKDKKSKGKHGHDKLKEELDDAKSQCAELNDKYLRLASEFDNFRKRTLKEKADLALTASESIIKELLPVLDDFERAMQNMEKSGNKADYDGVALIYNKLKTTLQKKGLEEIKATDADFNTDEHEALTNIPAPDESKKGKVLDVVQKGYTLNGKVIRYARVVVGS